MLYVGDSQSADVLGAKNAGMPVAWVNRDGASLKEGVPQPDHEIASLCDLLDLCCPSLSRPNRGTDAAFPRPLPRGLPALAALPARRRRQPRPRLPGGRRRARRHRPRRRRRTSTTSTATATSTTSAPGARSSSATRIPAVVEAVRAGGGARHQLRRADRGGGGAGADGRRGRAVDGDGALRQLRHRGDDERPAPGPRLHRPRQDRQVRGLLPRPRRRPAGAGRLRRRDAWACRTARACRRPTPQDTLVARYNDLASVERLFDRHARRDRRRHRRAGRRQHGRRAAAARLPGGAARDHRVAPARCSSSTR